MERDRSSNPHPSDSNTSNIESRPSPGKHSATARLAGVVQRKATNGSAAIPRATSAASTNVGTPATDPYESAMLGLGPLVAPASSNASAQPVQMHPAEAPVQRTAAEPAAIPESATFAQPIAMLTTASTLRVRSEPSTNGDNVVGSYARNTRVQVLGKQGDWLVITHEGQTAYIHGGYVTPAEAPETAGTATDSNTVGGNAAGNTEQGTATGASGSNEASGQSAGSMMNALAGMVVSFVNWLSELVAPTSEVKEETSGADKADGSETGSTGNESEETGTTDTGATVPSTRFFSEIFEVVDDDARLRDASSKHKQIGRNIPVGTKVYVLAAERTYVQIATAEGAAEVIQPADNIWTAFTNLGGTGADVALGNENTNAEDKQSADALRGSLPEGRNPGQSPFKWRFSGHFQPSLEGKNLESSLMSKVYRLMQWAIANDMVTEDIVISDGVRGPKTAHRICVAWEIQYGPGRVDFDSVKALPGGKDADGNVWYKDGWTWEEVKSNANSVRSSNKIAAAGYEYGKPERAPLPLNSRPGVSRHCTGRAVDVTIPWRTKGVHASKNQSDVWGWEELYTQFGLHRPLHKDKVSSTNLQECWHIEETSKKLEGNDDVA